MKYICHNVFCFQSMILANIRNYPAPFGRKLADLWQSLVTNKAGMPSLSPQVPSAKETFESLEFSDLWADAQMPSVCRWLRGGKDLEIPETFRGSLPKKF